MEKYVTWETTYIWIGNKNLELIRFCMIVPVANSNKRPIKQTIKILLSKY